jgi:hypothetical protein
MTRPRVAITSCRDYPDLDEDWPPLRKALEEHDLEATTQVWDEPSTAWGDFDLVVVRGTWDYIHRRETLVDWTRRVEAETTLTNSAAIVEWNTDKHYLADLAAAGVSTVPTGWLGPGAEWEPPAGDFVVKPTISAGGFETARYRANPDDLAAARAHVRRMHDDGRTVMLQPYMTAVDTVGETALLYFGGEFSHAINKAQLLRPSEGITSRLWEREVVTVTTPSAAQRATAETSLAVAAKHGGPTSYARVDVVPGPDGEPVVLELELVEPALFLTYSDGAATRFAAALAGLVS